MSDTYTQRIRISHHHFVLIFVIMYQVYFKLLCAHVDVLKVICRVIVGKEGCDCNNVDTI